MILKKEMTDVCPHYLSFLLDNGLRRMMQKPENIVGEYIGEGDTAVDLGCGPGFFTIAMAEMVGRSGKVFAVDLQERMLETVRKKALRAGLEERIIFHKTGEGKIGLERNLKADFILAYYMVHETGDYVSFLEEVKMFLKPGGKFLIVEPSFHVSMKKYGKLLSDVEKIGFTVLGKPEGKGGRTVLLTVLKEHD